MNTLEKILKQDKKVMDETIKLRKLQKQYLIENAKYTKKQIIYFNKDIFEKEIVLGIITDIRYLEGVEGLIRYSIKRLNKDKTPSKRDYSFYFRYQKDITPYILED